MMLARLNIWHRLRMAENTADRLTGQLHREALRAATAEALVHALRADVVELHRALDELRVERDRAWAKLDRRSAGVAKGNRTRRLARIAGLLPGTVSDITASIRAHPRTEHTG